MTFEILVYYLAHACIVRAAGDISFKALASSQRSVVCSVPDVAPLKSAGGKKNMFFRVDAGPSWEIRDFQ